MSGGKKKRKYSDQEKGAVDSGNQKRESDPGEPELTNLSCPHLEPNLSPLQEQYSQPQSYLSSPKENVLFRGVFILLF